LARIIRSDPEQSALISREMFESGFEAQRIIERAKALEKEILARAEEEAERVRNDARAKGLDEARAEAVTLLFQTRMLRDQALAATEKEIVDVALAAAERIVGYELEREPGVIASIVSPLLNRVRGANQVKVRVHPLDVEGLQEATVRLGSQAELNCAILVEPDPTMARGGCVVCTDIGTLDASIEVQLELLARVLGA
jgi:type III secretion protein L